MSRKNVMKFAAILSALIWISGCCTGNTRAPLPLPEPLNVPRVTVAEYACLSDDVALKLVERDVLFKERIMTLENIIKTTWGE